MNILVIDDDPSALEIFELIGELLPECRLFTASDFQSAKPHFEAHPIDLMILDVVLPELSGYDIARLLRQHPNTLAAYCIFMSSNRIELFDRLRAYNLQGQDFIIKPFEIEEMVLLLKSKLQYLKQLRELLSKDEDRSGTLCLGNFTLNGKLRTVVQNGQTIQLTQMEYRLLKYLLKHSEEVLNPEQLIEAIWDDKNHRYLITNTNLRSLIHKLRTKIEPTPKSPRYLLNFKSSGYIFYPSGSPMVNSHLG